VLHQYNNTLAYWIHEPFNPQTSCTDGDRILLPDPQDKSMRCGGGTRLAVTGDSAAKIITIFYQDQGGYLCCRCARCLYIFQNTVTQFHNRLANSFVWSEPVRLPTNSTVIQTGIAAVSWDGKYSLSFPISAAR
jgi:hypothetical protein